ncbi:MAG TPA: hypothetical protein VEU72_01990 [Nitrosopumilaceae archaeon]|nr:hypothetical protein [Nitrosopumilaceae archaeon]
MDKKILFLPVFAVLMYIVMFHDANATTIIGSATSCSTTFSCIFTIPVGGSASVGSGISFKLPGESLTSHGTVTFTGYPPAPGGFHVTGVFIAVDANTGKVVTGSFDYYILASGHSGKDSGITYHLNTGKPSSITFTLTTQDPTSTTVACIPSPIHPGGSTSCTITVKDTSFPSSIPTGTVNISTTSAFGTLSNTVCTLLAGSCSVVFTAGDEDLGGIKISGAYNGDTDYYTSSGSTSITVNTAADIPEFPFSFSLVIIFLAVAAVYLSIRQKMIPNIKRF